MICNIYDLYFRLDVPTGKPSIVAFRRNDNARPVLKYEGLFNVHDIERFLDEISLPALVQSSLFFCLQNITTFFCFKLSQGRFKFELYFVTLPYAGGVGKFYLWTNLTTHFTLLVTTLIRVWPKKETPLLRIWRNITRSALLLEPSTIRHERLSLP